MPRRPAMVLLTSLCWAVECAAYAQSDSRDAPAAEKRFRSHPDLTYQMHETGPLKLDLYLPTGKINKPLPLVIWVHGGGWRGGTRGLDPQHVAPAIENGFALASISYRLSDVAIFPAQIYDVKAAVRWLRAHSDEYHLDPQRFGAWGASAGGHLVALLGTSGDVEELEGNGGNLDQSSRVQAVCDWFGPTDFLRFDEQQQDGSPSANETDSLIALLLGGAPKETVELARLASPIHHITEDDPPLLIMHGDQDRIVPHEQSVVLRDAYRTARLDVELITFEETDHGGGEFNDPATTKRVWDFFGEHLHVKE